MYKYKVYLKAKVEPIIIEADNYLTPAMFVPDGHHFFINKIRVAYFPSERVDYVVIDNVFGEEQSP